MSRGGALFPHLYAPLPLSAVKWVKPLPLGADGRHVFPELDSLMALLEWLGRKALFAFEPETAHGLSIAALKSGVPLCPKPPSRSAA